LNFIFRSAGNDIVEPIQSARITSNFAFKYGRVEVRAKLPRGDWIWPGESMVVITDPTV
jgi:beta-glucanase (GH16 family)